MKNSLELRIAEALRQGKIESAEFEARQIVLAVANLGEKSETTAERMLKKRLSGEPLQYILGEWEFFGLTFKVGPGVLIPRPDTEVVVETALKLLKGQSKPRVVDVCAGSGCIGIALAVHSGALVTFIEKSREAIRFLKENVALNRVNAQIVECDVLQSPDFGTEEPIDLIVSNPPYIRSDVIGSLSVEVQKEPKMALDGGEDGLKFYRGITQKAAADLKESGHLVFEIGFDQAEEVSEILRLNGFKNIKIVKDYGGNDRVVYGTK